MESPAMMSKRNLLFGLVLLALAAIAAGLVWDRHQTRLLQETTLARIDAATRALRDVAVPAPATAELARALASGTERIEQELTALRGTAPGRIPQLAAGADGYLLTAREVLRRQTVMLQLRLKISAGIAAFRAHMGDRNAADWTTRAVQLKNGLEQDYREFQRTLDAHTKIVESLPEACKGLDTLVSGDRLVSAAEIKSLRETALTAATAVAGEINAVRQLAGPR
jgi:hypothetical protein